jgi:hypothetical protein
MARQLSAFITGTIEDLTFYKMYGTYYVRMKNSLSSRRFKKDKTFEGSRRSAERFAAGNALASQVYRMVPQQQRKYPLFCFLKRKAIMLLKEGSTAENAKILLIDYLQNFGFIKSSKQQSALRILAIKKTQPVIQNHHCKESFIISQPVVIPSFIPPNTGSALCSNTMIFTQAAELIIQKQ